jgi:hypothetical protein
MGNDVINALKRLERAGDAHSKATEKLIDAAKTLGETLENILPVGVDLPRGYKVIRVSVNVGSAVFLVREDYDEKDWITGLGAYLFDDFNAWIPDCSRQAALRFAEDVAEGLLDEFALFLEERAAKDEGATETLTAAISRLKGGE